jgi:hypothetical protein
VDIQSAIHAAMMTVSLATGFCPERWKKAIDVMLEKIPGGVRSNKLQSGQEKDGNMQEVSRYGNGQFSSDPPRGKLGNWHSTT